MTHPRGSPSYEEDEIAPAPAPVAEEGFPSGLTLGDILLALEGAPKRSRLGRIASDLSTALTPSAPAPAGGLASPPAGAPSSTALWVRWGVLVGLILGDGLYRWLML